MRSGRTASPRNVTRLHVAVRLGADVTVALDPAQAHQLRHVLRAETGDTVALFNGQDGEWRARLDLGGRAAATALCEAQTRPQTLAGGPWLYFAPVKRAGTDLTVEKATELGVARLQPVLTARTGPDRLNLVRLTAQAREAAEQSERLDLPELLVPVTLAAALAAHPADRPLFVADETGASPPIAELVCNSAMARGEWAVLVGPEGGFTPDELDLIRSHPIVRTVGLGPRVLRAETASLAALSILQALSGDWNLARAAGPNA